MDIDEREAYREFVRGFYEFMYHMPPNATADTYRWVFSTLLGEAEELLGREEIEELQNKDAYDL
jgi:hypothetical protein